MILWIYWNRRVCWKTVWNICMTMYQLLHLRNNADYLSRKEGCRGLASIKDCVKATIQRLEDNTKESKKRQITAANNRNIHRMKDKKEKQQTKNLGNKNGIKTIVCILQVTN